VLVAQPAEGFHPGQGVVLLHPALDQPVHGAGIEGRPIRRASTRAPVSLVVIKGSCSIRRTLRRETLVAVATARWAMFAARKA
jgi:hypothetical protein